MGLEAFQRCFPDVSRETLDRLTLYAELLSRWQARINLIGPATKDDLWKRHFLDSYQLRSLAADAQAWVDLGSGAGFPGLVIAMGLSAAARVHLVESNGKKCAFLREVIRVTGAPAIVHQGRIEDIVPELRIETIEIVTARALAPLPRLLDWAAPMLTTGARGLFLKGEGVATELTESARWWSLSYTLHPSLSDGRGCILDICTMTPRR